MFENTVTVDDCNKPPYQVSLPGLDAGQVFSVICAGYEDREWVGHDDNPPECEIYRTIFTKGDQRVVVTLTEY